MGKFSSQFKKAQEAKPITNFAQPPKLGSHRVGLRFVRGNETEKTKEVFIESEFTILESDSEQPGAVRGCAWFLNAGGWPGKYAESRLQEFLQAVADSLGDTRPLMEIGDELAEEEGAAYGIVLDVVVTPVADKADPDKARRGKNGRIVQNLAWTPVEQTSDDIEATRVQMDELASIKKPAAQPEKPAAAPASGGSKLGAAKRLLGAK